MKRLKKNLLINGTQILLLILQNDASFSVSAVISGLEFNIVITEMQMTL